MFFIGKVIKGIEDMKLLLDFTRKYYRDNRRFSDDCHYALYIRTLDRKISKNEIQYNRYSHFSDIGVLCETCTGHSFINGTCPKVQRTVFGSSTLHSSTVTNYSTLLPNETIVEKFCRICHSFGSYGDPLISPCRCTGSLKYVHISCLLHWLTICAHNLKRPAICELCLYKYRLRNTIDWQNLRLPSISRHDLRYLIIFIIAVALMFLSSITSLICFCIERKWEKNNDTMIEGNSETFVKGNNDWETLLSLSTLISAFLFFISLSVAIYAHIKTDTSLMKYLYRLWINNQNWIIEEYLPCRDQRYCNKMEQLRRRLNGNITIHLVEYN
ncbi:unnamed protein product [Cercopithifilaria johnstoni]|uniref:RING-CH-type domain-containing protein n=1 Tax=Cercopithifilaria johnstoni TaxID=2874296 RepID=A0A8J2Q041_9BILA|nr:unnamed protein product [Cercopithifilaria johnstoni]